MIFSSSSLLPFPTFPYTPNVPRKKSATTKTSAPSNLLPIMGRSDADIKVTLQENRIALTVQEAKRVTEFLGRDPSLTEATIWGIQGSEHCSYKSSKRFLRMFPTENRHVILGPGEDSGIVAITDGPPGKRWGLVVTHESHNKPSQIVPYEGAATGIGGTVRDVVCMGARVIGCLDMLRLGDLKTEQSRTIANEVVRGIAGYGNPLGIPNLGGDTVFDSGFNNQCLVNAIAVGLVREDEVIHSHAPKEAAKEGYDIVLVGKATDRSGFGGASFASATIAKGAKNTGAVQEPNPFLERHLLAATYGLFDWLAENNELSRISCKDLGAGGVVCASVEQVADCGFGADVHLDAVHTALPDLPPEVIACAETQERLCFVCHPELTPKLLEHYNVTWDLPGIAENARASVIGKVNDSGMFRLLHNGETVCHAKANDITCGLQYERPTEAARLPESSAVISCEGALVTVEHDGRSESFSLADIFTGMTTSVHGCSRAPVYRRFDKNVIGNTVVEAGEADASIIAPLTDIQSYVQEGKHSAWQIPEDDLHRGVALAADGNPRYGKLSPYLQGFNAVIESMRNVAAVGAVPRALTDCLNYGNPEKPEQLWMLEQGVRGITDAAQQAKIDGEPMAVISGNVSLYNGKADGSSIPPTAVVCCIGVIEDARTAVTKRMQKADSLLYLVGKRKDECGGSLYHAILSQFLGLPGDGLLLPGVPAPEGAAATREIAFVTNCIRHGSVLACHDISEGGLLLALLEMLAPERKIHANLGAELTLDPLGSSLASDVLLFSETGGFLLEVSPEREGELEELAHVHSLTVSCIGKTLPESELRVLRHGSSLCTFTLPALLQHWQTALEGHLQG